MQKTYRFKRTAIMISGERINIKQLFLGEDFSRKDIMDIQMHDHQILIQTRKNHFKCKYTDKQIQDAEELYSYLSKDPNIGATSTTIETIRVNYFGGHPQMPEEGWADMDIRTNRILISTF